MIDFARVISTANRGRLIDYLWKTGGTLPTRVPYVRPGVTGPFGSCTELVYNLHFDLVSIARYYIPSNPNGSRWIVHQGHAHDWSTCNLEYVINTLLGQQYSVITMHMPYCGDNIPRVASDADILPAHNALAAKENSFFNPLSLFLEPVIAVLNHLGPCYMTGCSGGGWTATVVAALDSRIIRAFPVAGSMPVYWRDPKDDGDWEQQHYPFYHIADHLDLYAMASKELLIQNQNDPICFAGNAYQTFVRDIVRAVNSNFDVRVDTSHSQHIISSWALQEMLNTLP